MCTKPYDIPTYDEKGKIDGWLKVPCRCCAECQRDYSDGWAFRAQLELSVNPKAVMLTLTYSPLFLALQNMEYADGTVNSLQVEVFQLWLKRFRRLIEPDKVRFFASGEYGENFTQRPHYHVIMFGIDNEHPIFKEKRPVVRHGKIDHYYIQNFPSWRYGQVEISATPLDAGAVRYATKYVGKKHRGRDAVRIYKDMMKHPEFILMSRKPGIGADGLKKLLSYYEHNPYGHCGKRVIALPRYIIDKIDELVDYDFKELLKIRNAEYRKTHPNNVNLKQKEKNLNAKNKVVR